MNVPQDIKYAKSHEWLRREGDIATLGISDFAQSELGDIVFVDITAAVGDDLNAGEVFGAIEAVKTVSDVYMPVAGKITEINQKVIDTPETINSDPYGDGWMIKFEITGDDSGLMDATGYTEMVGEGH